MGETLISQEFGYEHGKERPEEKDVSEEAEIAIAVAQSLTEQGDGLPDDKEKASEEKGAHKRVKDGIRRVVVAPVLITPEIVFEKRDRKSFGHRAPEITMVDFGRKDRDMGRARDEIVWMRDKEVIEHGDGGEKGA